MFNKHFKPQAALGDDLTGFRLKNFSLVNTLKIHDQILQKRNKVFHVLLIRVSYCFINGYI